MALGIVESSVGEDGSIKGLWFGRKDTSSSWGNNPTFEHYGEPRAVDPLESESFLYEISDSDLTEGSVANKLIAPRLFSGFMVQLRELAKLKKLTMDDMKARSNDSSTTEKLSTDLVRGKDWTLQKIKSTLENNKLNFAQFKLKADLLDLLLAFIVVKDTPCVCKLPPLASMLFFEAEREKLGASFDPVKVAESIFHKWKGMNAGQRSSFVQRAASANTQGQKRPHADVDAEAGCTSNVNQQPKKDPTSS